MYYIYHIPGIKIGCTSNLRKRMSDQGFTSWEILEEHTDIYEVSDREIELQREYGLPIDTIPYWQSVQNRYKFTEEDRAKGKAARTAWCSILGKRGNRKSKLTSEVIEKIRAEYDGTSKNQFNRQGPSLTELGKTYNVSASTISRIVHRHGTWTK